MNFSDPISVDLPRPSRKPSWWEQLVFQKIAKGYGECPNEKCREKYDSADVVCTKCGHVLAGEDTGNQDKTILINILRGGAVAVAFAVGYLHWMWPTYIFICILAVGFFSQFLRNHSTTRGYFLTIASVILVAEFVWLTMNQEEWFPSEATGVVLFVSLVAELLFLIAYSLRTGDDSREEWLTTHDIDIGRPTLTWITLLLTTVGLFVIAFAFARIVPQWFPPVLSSTLILQFALVPFSTALVTALVSSTIYSLHGQDFPITEGLKHHTVLKPLESRFLNYEPRTSSGWYRKIAETARRLAISSANGILRGITSSYNNLVVKFINNLRGSIVNIANLLRRIIIKTGRHVVRSLRRFIVVSKWSVKWALHTELHYSEIFLIPPIFILVGAVLLYSVSEDFFAYVHQGSALLPIYIGVKVLFSMVLFSMALTLLLHDGFLTFFEKVLNALSVFGTSAFLFFVLTAWGLGIAGIVTNGPYRIGWVTILSTLTLVTVFIIARRQPSDVDEDSHSSDQTPPI